MRNPWRIQDGPDNKINRNNFPMSFQYNGTFKYGKIYPIGLWRTIPGASYQIDSTLALNFMPTSFPIQTRQRAYVHFFYGRDRNFWKDYKDFVNGMNTDLVKPYIDEGVTLARTGNLLDYLGVPTTLVGRYGRTEEVGSVDVSSRVNFVVGDAPDNPFTSFALPYVSTALDATDYLTYLNSLSVGDSISIGRAAPTTKTTSALPLDISNLNFIGSTMRFKVTMGSSEGSKYDLSDTFTASTNSKNLFSPTNIVGKHFGDLYRIIVVSDSKIAYIATPQYESDGTFFEVPTTYKNSSLYYIGPSYGMAQYGTYSGPGSSVPYLGVNIAGVPVSIIAYSTSDEVQDIDENTSPYWRSNDNRGKATIKLSAIPPRMYETIYNLYYRNPQNNPYILNGKPEYNIFIPTKDGGHDPNLYELRYRNWEDDFLTTAVQTPQQGIAPLVGLTDRGATVTLTNEDGSVTRYKTNLDEQGNVVGIETTDSSEPLLTQALIDAVSYGISIEDLRNVNAMQKWLELNLRKGYQYKDIIEARWGISISYNELDLPEFIGGFTQEVGLQAVTQTTSHGEGIEGALGWQAGRMYASGSGRSITHYCEEEGYIMALLTVVPVPNYSQLLPKHWFTRDLLESYQPEFNHIGFQPITYKEVCPIQAFQESTQNVDVLEQTFGYQRPWYEYFNQVDEVHGQFRTTFKDFLINRTFDVKPELSESFLLVDPNQVNDVFAVQTDDDKIIGAIEHRITAKLPISLYAQARLE